MRCYVQISSWKETISRHFILEALNGIETVRQQQALYTTNPIQSRTQYRENRSPATSTTAEKDDDSMTI